MSNTNINQIVIVDEIHVPGILLNESVNKNKFYNRLHNPIFFTSISLSKEYKKIFDELDYCGIAKRRMDYYKIINKVFIQRKNIKTKKQPSYVSLMGHYKHK